MTPDDVAYLVQWQQRNQLRINMVFNGRGSASIGPDGSDPLTTALLANKNAFGWINHTWSHLYLSCVPDHSVTPWRCATIPIFGDVRYVPGPRLEEEIKNNIEFAKRHDLPIDPTELVTGEHSGLRALPETPEDNPRLGEALIATGIRITASDATRELEQRTIGSALTLPRHPIGVAYNTGTVAEVVDKYSFDRTSKADGGSGDCSDNCIAPLDPRTGYEDLLRREVGLASRYIFANDPRPHYLHQSNLAEERTVYPVLERILQRYRGLMADNRPLVAPTMTEAASMLFAQGAYRQGLADGQIAAWIKDGVVTVETTRQVPIPLTAPEGTTHSDGQLFGQPYGAERSAWIAIVGQQRFVLPGGQL